MVEREEVLTVVQVGQDAGWSPQAACVGGEGTRGQIWALFR